MPDEQPTGEAGETVEPTVDADRTPEETLVAYFAARAAGDGATACALIHPENLSNFGTDPASCAADLSTPTDERAAFAAVEVTGPDEECDSAPGDTEYTSILVNGDPGRSGPNCYSLAQLDGIWMVEDS